MGAELAVREWIERPEFAAGDWPVSDLSRRRLPMDIALRLVKADNVVGRLTRVTPHGLEIDHGVHRVPSGVVRAYALLHRPREA